MTAGAGYLASIQHHLVFGLGEARKIDRLEVRWPGGATQEFKNLDVNREWLLIEGDDEPR